MRPSWTHGCRCVLPSVESATLGWRRPGHPALAHGHARTRRGWIKILPPARFGYPSWNLAGRRRGRRRGPRRSGLESALSGLEDVLGAVRGAEFHPQYTLPGSQAAAWPGDSDVSKEPGIEAQYHYSFSRVQRRLGGSWGLGRRASVTRGPLPGGESGGSPPSKTFHGTYFG
jgi:hypothetical protein